MKIITSPFVNFQAKTREIETKLRIIDILAATLGCLGIIFMTSEADFYYTDMIETIGDSIVCIQTNPADWQRVCQKGMIHFEENSKCSLLRSLTCISTLVLLFIIILRYSIYLKYLKFKMQIGFKDTLISTRLIWWLILELCYLMIVLPPKVNYSFVGVQQKSILIYTFDSLVSTIIVWRVYLFWRIFTRINKWNNEKSEQICENYQLERGDKFSVKAQLKEYPYVVLGIILFISICDFGYDLKMLEQPYEYISLLNWDYMTNGMWNVVIAMATVGYGDYFPRTHLGRFCIVWACLLGQFFISLMVMAFTNTSTLSENETKAFWRYKDTILRIKVENKAIKAIQMAYIMHCRLRKKTSRLHKRIKNIDMKTYNMKFKKSLIEFRTDRKNQRSYHLEQPLKSVLYKVSDKVNKQYDNILHLLEKVPHLAGRSVRLLKKQQDISDLLDKLYLNHVNIIKNIAKHYNVNESLIIRLESNKIPCIDQRETNTLIRYQKILIPAKIKEIDNIDSPTKLKKNLTGLKKTEEYSPHRSIFLMKEIQSDQTSIKLTNLQSPELRHAVEPKMDNKFLEEYPDEDRHKSMSNYTLRAKRDSLTHKPNIPVVNSVHMIEIAPKSMHNIENVNKAKVNEDEGKVARMLRKRHTTIESILLSPQLKPSKSNKFESIASIALSPEMKSSMFKVIPVENDIQKPFRLDNPANNPKILSNPSIERTKTLNFIEKTPNEIQTQMRSWIKNRGQSKLIPDIDDESNNAQKNFNDPGNSKIGENVPQDEDDRANLFKQNPPYTFLDSKVTDSQRNLVGGSVRFPEIDQSSQLNMEQKPYSPVRYQIDPMAVIISTNSKTPGHSRRESNIDNDSAITERSPMIVNNKPDVKFNEKTNPNGIISPSKAIDNPNLQNMGKEMKEILNKNQNRSFDPSNSMPSDPKSISLSANTTKISPKSSKTLNIKLPQHFETHMGRQPLQNSTLSESNQVSSGRDAISNKQPESPSRDVLNQMNYSKNAHNNLTRNP